MIGRQKELTQKEIAQKLGISQSYISRQKKDPGKVAKGVPATDELRIMPLKNTYNCIDKKQWGIAKNNGECFLKNLIEWYIDKK